MTDVREYYLNYGIPLIIAFTVFVMVAWYKTTGKISRNQIILQGIQIFSMVALSMTFLELVVDAYSKSINDKEQMEMDLIRMNHKYWIGLLNIFMQSEGGLDDLATEIFDDWKIKSKANPRKEYFVIHYIFQMLADVYRLDDQNLQKGKLTGWNKTFEKIFSSQKIKKQWAKNMKIHGNDEFHDFVKRFIK